MQMKSYVQVISNRFFNYAISVPPKEERRLLTSGRGGGVSKRPPFAMQRFVQTLCDLHPTAQSISDSKLTFYLTYVRPGLATAGPASQ